MECLIGIALLVLSALILWIIVRQYLLLQKYKELIPEVKDSQDDRDLLAGIMKNLPGMVYRSKYDGKYTPLFVSEGVKGLLGLSPEEVKAQGITGAQYIPEEYLQRQLEKTRKAVEEGGIHESIFPFDINGKRIWVLNRFFASGVSEDGYPVTDGIIIDISKQIESEEALKENSKMLSLIFNGTKDYMGLVRVGEEELTVMSVNDSLINGFAQAGVDIQEANKRELSLREFLTLTLQFQEELVEMRMQHIKESIQSREIAYFEETIRRPDGKVAFLETQAIPLRAREDTVTHVLYVSRDITRKRLADDTLLAAIIDAEDKEKDRIAKEIHDSLGQLLTSAAMNFKRLRKQIEADDDMKSAYQAGLKNLHTAIEESRSIAYGLMPKAIHDFGLVLALESLLEGLRKASEIIFQFNHNLTSERLEKKIERSLYRIAQISLDNILKHAKASEVSIQLMKHTGGISFMIEDDGIGFDKNTFIRSNSMGFNSLKTRVMSLMGTLDIESDAGKGTLIHVEIPQVKSR
ncbi:MAG: PAS domain S-box protein [Bacteroidota bacterium]